MKLNSIDLNKLKNFHSVYNHGSIQASAQELHVTPSAVSQSIKSLEIDLKSQLFVRTSKGLIPTEKGKKLFLKLSPFLYELEGIYDEFHNENTEPQGLIRVGTPTEFGGNIVLEKIIKFRKKYPKVSFKLEYGVPEKNLQKLLLNELDFCFLDDGPYWKKFKSRVSAKTVFQEELILCCSSSFFKKFLEKKINFEELVKLPHITYLENISAVKIWYRHHFKKAPQTLKQSIIVESVHTVIKSTLKSQGLSMIPKYLVKSELKSGKLKEIKFRKPLINDILLGQLNDKVPRLAEKLFVSEFNF